MQQDDNKIHVAMPAALQPSIGLALVRAGYLFPQINCEETGAGVLVSGEEGDDLRAVAREIGYLVYREHIRAEFAPYRRKAFARVYGGAA